jgi:hypothetical protein
MSSKFSDFGDLYRAAFAETDPETKQVLLAEVKRALDMWAISSTDFTAISPRRPQHQSSDPVHTAA